MLVDDKYIEVGISELEATYDSCRKNPNSQTIKYVLNPKQMYTLQFHLNSATEVNTTKYNKLLS